MSAGYFLEIFGGAGAVIIAVGGCLWKCLRSYEFKYDYEDEERSATDVLKSTWENKGIEFPIEEDFGENYNRLKFSTKKDGNWNVNIDKGHGGVYLYFTTDRLPPSYNKKKHYLRINIRNVKKSMKVIFEHKCFGSEFAACGHRNLPKNITKDGEHIFEPECLIDLSRDGIVKQEQLGVSITGEHEDIKNIIIDEAYYGERWSFCKIFCCCKHRKTILYRKKQVNDE